MSSKSAVRPHSSNRLLLWHSFVFKNTHTILSCSEKNVYVTYLGQVTFFEQCERWHSNLSDPAISFILAALVFVLFKIQLSRFFSDKAGRSTIFLTEPSMCKQPSLERHSWMGLVEVHRHDSAFSSVVSIVTLPRS